MQMIKQISKHLQRAVWVGAATLILAGGASAAVRQHTFSISGDNGETGTGSFTWDDAVVANGTALNTDTSSLSANLLTVNITVSGGNVVGGTASFTKATCQGAYLQDTPNFASDINFWCDNGTNSLFGVIFYTNALNQSGTTSTLTFTPGATVVVSTQPVPTLSEWAMIFTASLMALGTVVVMRRRG